MDARLPFLLWIALSYDGVTAEDVVDEWLAIDPDDARLSASLLIHLRPGPVTLPDGGTALVVRAEQDWRAVDVWVQLGAIRAGLTDLVQAARTLMTADDPPAWPGQGRADWLGVMAEAKATASAKAPPAQLLLF